MPEPKYMLRQFMYLCFRSVLIGFIVFACSGAVTAKAAQDIRTWSALQEAINGAESGDTIKLQADLTAGAHDSSLRIPDGTSITLDLNGHTIDRNLKENGGSEGTAIYISAGALLTVKDSSADSAGSITGGYGADGGGIRNIGTLILEGGSVTGNRTSDRGGGIANYSVLVISGGTVTGNTADEKGGGIFNGIKGRLTLENGAVYANDAPQDADVCNIGAVGTVGGDFHFYTALTSYLEMLAVLPTLVLLTVLFFAVMLDNYLDKGQKRILYLITVLVFTLVIQNYFESRVPGDRTLLRTLLAVWGYAVRPAILALFLHLIRPGRPFRLVWAAVGINAALYLTALFSPLTFYFSGGHFHQGPLHQTCLIVSAALFADCLYLTFRVFRPKQRKETWIPVFALLIISLSVAMDYTVTYHYQPVSFLTIAITISSMMYYIWLHLQFVREHERALEAEHRIQIMMTQIQPHFLFNTLTAIRALCIKDQNAAVRTIGLFSAYLRQNLESLNQSELIPLAKELEHTRIYTEIEMIRFPNIRVEYDIRDEACSVPALTVQPLVENAIRHGVREREEGIVKVTAYREGGVHLIVIADNGVGFDAQQVKDADGTHIGIRNVRERLAQMCHGQMEIDSRPDEGTKIVLTIPVDEEMNG